jgi:SynChlorMet cassette protein ScmC
MEFQLLAGAQVIAQGAEATGGLLLHGALAEFDRHGFILAGPGGVGKTTASNRLESPWQPLSDDATLVVRTAGGQYYAHPWPTWSRFMFGGTGGSWDVEHGVPLKGILFLAQALANHVRPLGAGHAVTHLVQTSEQALLWPPSLSADRLRLRRSQIFDNVCALAKSIPCYQLDLSLTGEFWREIERVLALPETQPRRPRPGRLVVHWTTALA